MRMQINLLSLFATLNVIFPYEMYDDYGHFGGARGVHIADITDGESGRRQLYTH